MNDVITLVNTNRGNGKKESLTRMFRLLEKIGNPQLYLKFVHIAGTNGKGSTASFLSSILNATSIKTGVFTSPHLEDINERIRINSRYITDTDFIQATEKVAQYVEIVEEELDERLYSFEILTAVALLYFYEKECELVVLETGIGGRLDATNTILTPEVALITSIGLDHMKVLGTTKEEIAEEKVNILKENGLLIYPEMEEELEAVFEKRAEEINGQIQKIKADTVTELRLTEDKTTFSYKNYTDIVIHLLGKHQVMNACLAIEAAETLRDKGYSIPEKAILTGLSEAHWPGRMEKISEKPLIILDGAHNSEGVKTLKATLDSLFPEEKFTFIVGMMQDKKYHEMLEDMLPIAEEIYTLSPDPYRGFNAKQTAEELSEKGITSQAYESVDAVIEVIRNESKESKKIIVFGSLYLIGDFRKQWNNTKEALSHT